MFIKPRGFQSIGGKNQIEEPPLRLKSYSQNDKVNSFEEINDDSGQELYVNVNLSKAVSRTPQNGSQDEKSQNELQLNQDLQQMLKNIQIQQGTQNVILSMNDLGFLINSIEKCMLESSQMINQKDLEISKLRKELQQKQQTIHQQQSTILSLQNEYQEQIHLQQINKPGVSPQNFQNNPSLMQQRLMQLEQENEMLQIENKQAIKLAVQVKNKKGEKELGDMIAKMKNDKSKDNNSSILRNSTNASNYQSLLNAQFNKNIQGRKNSTKGSGVNKSFNLF